MMMMMMMIIMVHYDYGHDDGDGDDGDGYLSGAVTLADICLEKLPWETKCGIIQPTNSL